MTGPGRWAVVCDFDGTATTEDVGDQVAVHFAGEAHYLAEEDRYREGAFVFSELLRRIFRPITATREEIAAFARERAVLRHGFERFLLGCREAGWPVVICSAGLDVYIEPVLARLPPPLRDGLTVRANAARCSSAGLDVRFHGGGELDCGRCGFCKGKVVRQLQAAGHRVAVVGDGTADRCAAEAADAVFARRGLSRWCAERGIPFCPFESFDEVVLPPPAAR
ncbi:MAG: HAD-IB family phosphatase [Deltaproteobacteria bacterium]|nr:HAD-IB family phosphatase [Deltaproteobacteria bacterium]